MSDEAQQPTTEVTQEQTAATEAQEMQGVQEAQVPASEPTLAERIEAEVEAWWNDHMPGSVLAQSTPALNHVRTTLEDLKTRLKALVS